MANRARRGGAAALFAARMTDEVEVTDDDEVQVIAAGEPDDDGEPDPIIDEPDEPEPDIDRSHEHEEEPEPQSSDALDELNRQLEQMRAERDAAREQAARGEAAELYAQHTQLVSAHRAAKSQLDVAQEEYAAAAAKADWKGAAAAQVKIAQATTDMAHFEDAAAEVEAAIKKPRAKPTQQPPADQFEAAIAGMSEASKQWCRANKADLQKSPTRGQKAMLAHAEALEAGLKPDTPEYFDHLNKQMGYAVTKQTATRKPKPTGQPRVAAPAGARSAPANGRGAEVRLSAAEVQMARSLGMSTKDYAKHKQELIKNASDPARSGPRYSEHTAANRR